MEVTGKQSFSTNNFSLSSTTLPPSRSKPRGGSREGKKSKRPKARSSPRPAHVYAAQDDAPSTSFSGIPSVVNFGNGKRGDASSKRPHISDKVELVKLKAKVSKLTMDINKMAMENLDLRTMLAKRKPENPKKFLENKRGSLEMAETLISKDRRLAQIKTSLVLKKLTAAKRQKQLEVEIGLHNLDERHKSKLQLKSLIFAEKSEMARLRQLKTKIDKIQKKRKTNFQQLLTILGRVQSVTKRVVDSSLYGSMQDLAKKEAFFAHGSDGLSVTGISAPGKKKKELPSLFGKRMPKPSLSKPKAASHYTNTKVIGISFQTNPKSSASIVPRGGQIKLSR